jgi:hypothetical protein
MRMNVTVKKAQLWRTETGNAPGALARTLQPLAEIGENLAIVMGYAYPDRKSAAIEVYPITTPRGRKAAKAIGLMQWNSPCIVVTGPNRPGLGHEIARRIAEAGINLNFFVAQVIGKQYTGMFGFEAWSEADFAARIIRNASTGRTRANGKPAAGRKASVRRTAKPARRRK